MMKFRSQSRFDENFRAKPRSVQIRHYYNDSQCLAESNKFRNNVPTEQSEHKRVNTLLFTPESFDLGAYSLAKHLRKTDSKLSPFQPASRNTTIQDSDQIMCLRHPNEPAIYMVVGDNNQATLYCEACAVQIASKGYSIKKILNCCQAFSQRPVKRNNCTNISLTRSVSSNARTYNLAKSGSTGQLDNFMLSLQNIIDELVTHKRNNHLSLAKLETEYSQQIETATQYFKSVQLMLDFEKNNRYNQILRAKEHAETEVKRVAQVYENCIQEMRRVLDSLSTSTLHKLKGYELQQILQEYSSKMEEFARVKNSVPAPLQFKVSKLRDLAEVQGLLTEVLQNKATPRQRKRQQSNHSTMNIGAYMSSSLKSYHHDRAPAVLNISGVQEINEQIQLGGTNQLAVPAAKDEWRLKTTTLSQLLSQGTQGEGCDKYDSNLMELSLQMQQF